MVTLLQVVAQVLAQVEVVVVQVSKLSANEPKANTNTKSASSFEAAQHQQHTTGLK